MIVLNSLELINFIDYIKCHQLVNQFFNTHVISFSRYEFRKIFHEHESEIKRITESLKKSSLKFPYKKGERMQKVFSQCLIKDDGTIELQFHDKALIKLFPGSTKGLSAKEYYHELVEIYTNQRAIIKLEQHKTRFTEEGFTILVDRYIDDSIMDAICYLLYFVNDIDINHDQVHSRIFNLLKDKDKQLISTLLYKDAKELVDSIKDEDIIKLSEARQ